VRTRKAYRFRIYPSEEQRRILERTLQTCRILYNNLLAERRDNYKKTGRAPSYYEQKRGLTKRRNANPYLPQVHSQVLQDVALRLEGAFERFFKRDKSGRKAGYPRFKGRNRYDSFTYPQYGNGAMLKDGRLKLSKIGAVRIFQHRPIPPNSTVKTCTIRRDVDKWYACFTVEIDDTTTKPRGRQSLRVGVDVGLNLLVALSDGEKVQPPKFLRKMERKLKREQRRLSRKKKHSKNWTRQTIKVAKAHRKVRVQRGDFNHKLSRMLVNRFGMIVFEKLRIQNMVKNHRLAKSIADAGWGQLQAFTSYKAAEAGAIVKFVDPSNTTADCSRCGFHVPKTLSERIHKCPNCGFMLDRDWNAAVNILNRVGWGTAELTPGEIQPLLRPCVVAEQVGSRNQEAHDF